MNTLKIVRRLSMAALMVMAITGTAVAADQVEDIVVDSGITYDDADSNKITKVTVKGAIATTPVELVIEGTAENKVVRAGDITGLTTNSRTEAKVKELATGEIDSAFTTVNTEMENKVINNGGWMKVKDTETVDAKTQGVIDLLNDEVREVAQHEAGLASAANTDKLAGMTEATVDAQIDADVFALKDGIVKTNTESINSLDGRATGLEIRASVLELRADSAQDDIKDITKDGGLLDANSVADQNFATNAVNNLRTGEVATNAENINELDKYVGNNMSKLAGVETSVLADLDDKNTKLGALKDQSDSTTLKVSVLEDRADSAQNDIEALEAENFGQDLEIIAVKNKNKSQDEDIALNTESININTKQIIDEQIARKNADKELAKKDVALDGKITEEALNRKAQDAMLKGQIIVERNARAVADKELAYGIKSNSQNIAKNSNRLDQHEDRMDGMEKDIEQNEEGIAIMGAFDGIASPYKGEGAVGAGVSTFGGKMGWAVGAGKNFKLTETGSYSLTIQAKGGMSGDTAAGNAGATLHF